MQRNLDRREFLTAVSAGLALPACKSTAPPAADLRLWYGRPAAEWVEALPVGNGRLGAMVFGGVSAERIQFNEDTVWQGEPHDYARAGAHRYLERIRRLLADGKQAAAEQLAMDEFMSAPLRQKAYQAFADLTLEFSGIDAARVADYERGAQPRRRRRRRCFRSRRRRVRPRGLRLLPGSGARRSLDGFRQRPPELRRRDSRALTRRPRSARAAAI